MKEVVVAIVGRPNVGKSTFFNRVIGKRIAIVDDESGVTRDRHYGHAAWSGYRFLLVDTGGMVPNTKDPMEKQIMGQAEAAIYESDVVLFFVDGKTGITDLDQMITAELQKSEKPVLLVVNKVDNQKEALQAYEFFNLGLGEPFFVSSLHGRGVGDVLEEMISFFPKEAREDLDEDIVDDELKIAIVGKPNVGKSSLVNRILGEEKMIVSNQPGTTRDAVDSHLEIDGRKVTLIDTAGLRRKSKVKFGIEYFSNLRAISTINRADIVFFLMEADRTMAKQEKRIINIIQDQRKPTLLLLNKWDLLEKDTYTFDRIQKELAREFPFIGQLPILSISALTGQRVHKIFELAFRLEEESKKRVPTGQFNRFIAQTVAHFPPTHSVGRHTRIYYATQQQIQPPTFVFFVNYPENIIVSYKRFLENKIREQFGFEGVPIQLIFRSSQKETINEEDASD